MPKMEDLFSSRWVRKLDLSQAYLQVCLDEQSKSLVVVNTPKGCFVIANRLPYGISSAPAIFQWLVESVLEGLPQVVVYLDDILISGATLPEHLNTLELVY